MMRFIVLFYVFSHFAFVHSDYYELLGISRDADDREIRKAFKTLALKLHPDKNIKKENAHENFVEINKAYEVLKDPETRKKYDLHGEDGLKEDFGNTWKGNYRSWNFYQESFGIYDDDEEIISLNRNGFEQSVFESDDLWFINFYSPHCSHCHTLAPTWRRLARAFNGIIRIGAVNCGDASYLCSQQNIYSYPSLVFYPQGEKYNGLRDFQDLNDFILEKLPHNVLKLQSDNYAEVITQQNFVSKPWLIFSCSNSDGCVISEDIMKLAVILENLVNLAEIDSNTDKDICNFVSCKSPITYHELHTNPLREIQRIPILETDISSIIERVSKLLPDFEEFDFNRYEDIRKDSSIEAPETVFLCFLKNAGKMNDFDFNIKRVKAFFPNVTFGYLNCERHPNICSSIYIKKFPTFVLFKPGGSYEIHHGTSTAYDLTKFIRQAIPSQVKTLTPEEFPNILESGKIWFIDFFAPWCAPCMQFLPHWRKSSQSSEAMVNFGTIDCTIHITLCRNYGIRSYPTAILYNETTPHKYHGKHSSQELIEFVKDVLFPSVIALSPEAFKNSVLSNNANEIWIVDFFAPWCGPCQQLSPNWKKVAKFYKDVSHVHVAEIDCEKYQEFCLSSNVRSYPTIRLYPSNSNGVSNYVLYNGRNRDASSLQAWIQTFLPSKVKTLTTSNFVSELSNNEPWVIDFFAPWCGHCHAFTPVFEKVAEVVEGKVKTGKIDCDRFPTICESAQVRAYPTVIFYNSERNRQEYQNGDEIHVLTFNGIIQFLENKLKIKFQGKQRKHDEL